MAVEEEVFDILRECFGDAVVSTEASGAHPYALIKAERWPEVALFLRDDPRLLLNMLRCITSIDMIAEEKLACVYDMMYLPDDCGDELITETREFAVRIETPRDNPLIPSVAHVWPAADWHEREAYDMMGIHFSGHPDHRRILCPDDWVGYPLRKDYVFPLEYHGIPGTTEYDLPNPRH